MVSAMKAYYSGQAPQAMLTGAILILVGVFGVTGGVLQAQQASSTTLSSPTNGTHLYGEAAQPDQTGKGYVTFSYQNGKVVGAFYYPRSEFDCFAGSLKDNILDVKSIGAGHSEVVAMRVNLSDLHPIPTPSDIDQRMISICQRETAALLS